MNRLLITLLLSAVTSMATQAQQHKLWYSQPARHWLEALPVGNSHLGAMVYGKTDTEEIQFNEETFWSGSPHNNNSPEAKAHLQEVRDSIFAGKEEAAHAIIDKYALATTSYIYKGVKYERTVFASQADNVIIVRIKADKKRALSFGIAFTSQLQSKVIASVAKGDKGQMNLLSATVEGVEQEGIQPGLKADCKILVEADGDVKTDGESFQVKDASIATLYITAATNFVNYQNVSGDGDKKNKETLASLHGKTYDQLLKAHLQKYQEQYNRVSLTLGDQNTQIPTDQRLAQFDGSDLDMVSLMMQYGRYLLISSSQPGGQPANLQGVWNDKKDAPWDSKYTININAEMNYWPALVGNLAETQQPFFSMIRDLSETGTKTAQEMYGCHGWVAHHNTDLWRVAGPIDGTTWGMFPTGGAWLTTHLWQHYLYTGDKQFLAEYYPVMKGAADFLLDYLQPYPADGYIKNAEGWLVTAPTVSPEHGPVRPSPPPRSSAKTILHSSLFTLHSQNFLPCKSAATASCRSG